VNTTRDQLEEMCTYIYYMMFYLVYLTAFYQLLTVDSFRIVLK